MKILAIDTSCAAASAAVIDEYVVTEAFINNGLTHSQTLVQMIDAALDSCSIAPKDIDAFAVTVGPGSFTGLRIGIGTVKGMAGDRPCFAVNTLDALAYGVSCHTGVVCAMLDARNAQVYAAVYKNSKLEGDYMACGVKDILNGEMFDDTLFVGDGAIANMEAITERYHNAVIPINSLMLPRASVIGLMAQKLPLGKSVSASGLTPFYLKQSAAERKLACDE